MGTLLSTKTSMVFPYETVANTEDLKLVDEGCGRFVRAAISYNENNGDAAKMALRFITQDQTRPSFLCESEFYQIVKKLKRAKGTADDTWIRENMVWNRPTRGRGGQMFRGDRDGRGGRAGR